MKTTYQYRMYPQTAQAQRLAQGLRICRYWYNRMLRERLEWWEHNRTSVNACPLVCHLPELKDRPNYYNQKLQLPAIKEDLALVKWSGELLDFSEVYSTVLQDVCQRVEKTFGKLAKQEGRLHQQIARSRKDFQYKSAYKLVATGKKVFFHEDLNIAGLTKRNTPKQHEPGKYLPNGQSAKSGLNKSWLDAAFGQFFSILGYIAGKAGAVVIEKNPAYTSQLVSYKDEFIFTNRSIRKYWDEDLKIWVDRDINAAINLKRLGLDVFPSIKRRRGNPVVVSSTTNSTAKEVLTVLFKASEAHAALRGRRWLRHVNSGCPYFWS